jgi:outer membrane protein TolC
MKSKIMTKNVIGKAALFLIVIVLLTLNNRVDGQPLNSAPQPIDLPTALRLAGAQNLDVQIARERTRVARANRQSTVAQFFPWITAGAVYRQHDLNTQDVVGNILEVHKYSYAPGAALNLQLDLGDAWFKSLAAKQTAQAAAHAEEAQRQESVLAAAQGYFDLALAQAAVRVAADAVRISADYAQQLAQAVGAGVAFKGDALRAQGQRDRNELLLRQATEQQRVVAARLAQILRLDPTVELVSADVELVPLNLVTNRALDSLVARALGTSPELKQSAALSAAAREEDSGATYGPLMPTISGQAFFGGLGGGRDGIDDSFGGQRDYFVGATWRLGPGGLFDFTRTKASEARRRAVELGGEKLKDDLIRQVVQTTTRYQSLAEQVDMAKRALASADETLQLAQQRQEFGVAVVLERVLAEEDLTRARLGYLRIVAESNKADYQLLRLAGEL